MADRLSGVPPPPPPSPPHQNGTVGAPRPPPASGSPLRTRRERPSEGRGSGRPRGQSLASVLSSWTRTVTPRSKLRSSQQEEPEALLDLILECQNQRLEDQRADLSLLPDPEPAALCGACSPDTPPLPGLDLYCMILQYQSDRMEDQRCSLPGLEDLVCSGSGSGSGSEAQEDFFSLVQRLQSRRLDEQRAWPLDTHTHTHTEDTHTHTEDTHTHTEDTHSEDTHTH